MFKSQINTLRLAHTLLAIAVGAAAVAISGCSEDSPPAKPAEPQPPISGELKIDGVADDWPAAYRVLEEAGSMGTKFENNIDVKQVYLRADKHYLYGFLRCTPTPAQRYKVEPMTGGIVALYFDVDNDRSTGCKQAEIHFHPDLQDGLEVELSLEISVGVEWTPKGGQKGYYHTECGLKDWDSSKKEFDFRGDSMFGDEAKAGHVADGRDGVEFAVPLKDLGITPGSTVRIFLKEDSNCWEKEGFNELTFSTAETR